MEKIKSLRLSGHPEGGFYRETFRSTQKVQVFWANGQERSALTSVLFMLSSESPVSRMHRLQADEVWNYHEGNCDFVIVTFDGYHVKHSILGPSTGTYQLVVPGGIWFGSVLAPLFEEWNGKLVAGTFKAGDFYALAGCSVAPGFEMDDFELAPKNWSFASKFPILKHMT